MQIELTKDNGDKVDVTGLYIQVLEGSITKDEWENKLNELKK